MSRGGKLPDWVKQAAPIPITDEDIEEQNGRLNYLQGYAWGQETLIDQYEQQIAELEQQVDIARAYERERIAVYYENSGLLIIPTEIRSKALDD